MPAKLTHRDRVTELEQTIAPPPPKHIEPDIISFAENTLGLKPLDTWQRDLLTSDARKVILNICRQAGKSTIAATMAIYESLTIPDSLTLLVSPSLRQSTLLFSKVMHFYDLAGRPVDTDKETQTELKLANGSEIYSLPSNETSIRGFSKPSSIIIDEAARADSTLIAAALMPMLLISESSRIWLISTPWGYGTYYEKTYHDPDNGWLKIEVNAYGCPRISEKAIESQRANLLDWQFKQELLCSFESSQTQLLSEHAIKALFIEHVELWSL